MEHRGASKSQFSVKKNHGSAPRYKATVRVYGKSLKDEFLKEVSLGEEDETGIEEMKWRVQMPRLLKKS